MDEGVIEENAGVEEVVIKEGHGIVEKVIDKELMSFVEKDVIEEDVGNGEVVIKKEDDIKDEIINEELVPSKYREVTEDDIVSVKETLELMAGDGLEDRNGEDDQMEDDMGSAIRLCWRRRLGMSLFHPSNLTSERRTSSTC